MVPDLPLWQWLILFALSGALLVRAGVSLAGAGDEIAERSGLSRLFVGSLFLALATSLPELITDVSAAVAGAPDLAVGDLFGSSMANMAILAVLDLWHRGRVWPAVELHHARVGAAAIGLTALVVLAILTPPGLSIGWVGVDTIGVVLAYVGAVAWFRRSARPTGSGAPTPRGLHASTGWTGTATAESRAALRSSITKFVGGAAGILVSAPLAAVAAREIADRAGIAQTVVGAGLLAITTSLPELVASLAAVRLGAHDLAVGNLFGSNAANMGVLVFADAAYTDGPILAAVDPAQAVAAVGAILLMALALAAIVAGTEMRIGRLEPDAVVLLIAYVGALIAVGVAA